MRRGGRLAAWGVKRRDCSSSELASDSRKASDQSQRVMMKHQFPIHPRRQGSGDSDRPEPVQPRVIGLVVLAERSQGVQRDTARQYRAFTVRRLIQTHAYGVRLSRAR